MSETQTRKPVAKLSHTYWLTNARDAQVGDAIVRVRQDDGVVEEYTIKRIVRENGELALLTYDGEGKKEGYTASGINRSRHAVVEYRQDERDVDV